MERYISTLTLPRVGNGGILFWTALPCSIIYGMKIIKIVSKKKIIKKMLTLFIREPVEGQLKKSRGSLPIIGAHITPRFGLQKHGPLL